MIQRSDFQKTMEEARNGSEAAFEELVNRYSDHVKRYLKRQISLKLQSKVGESDIAQMVWASFFDNRSQLVRFTNSHEMLAYLRKMASNKVRGEAKRFKSAKRSLDAEMNIDEPTPYATNSVDTPSQFAISQEKLDNILAALEERDQNIILMRLDGLNRVEIADELNLNEATVRKVLTKAEQRGRDVDTPPGWLDNGDD